MSQWDKLELVPMFERIINAANEWDPKEVIPNIVKIGELIKYQLDDYFEGKYRRDRNEVLGYFESIEKFSQTNLPISLDHFTQLTKDYLKRITPYPHYSGIIIQLPDDLSNIKEISTSNIPELDKTDNEDAESSLKLM